MNIKDSYIHNGTAVLKDVKVENSVLKKILAGKDANDAYLGWETVCDLTVIKPKAAGTADKVGHKLTFSGGVTGTWDGSADKTVTIPTKSSWNYDDVYLKLTGNGTTNPLTGTIYIKDVNGIILNSSNKDLNIWEVYGNSGAWASQYGFNLQYLGTGEGNSNDLILWAHNQTGTHVESYRVKQDGTFIFKAAPKVGTNIMYHAGNLTIKTLMGTTAIGDTDEPVYWNGSSFVKAGTYPTKASWNYDDRYLKLSGGTLTGKLTIKTNGFGNQLTLDRGSDGGSWGPGIMFYDNGTFLACLGVDTSGTLYKGDNGGTKYAIYHANNLTPKTITLSTTAQTYITAAGTNYTIKMPSTDPYTSARTPTAHTHYATTYKDSRYEAMTPTQGVAVNGIAIDFKTKANGVDAGSGSYCGLITFDPYSDSSGGYPMQIGFNTGTDSTNTNEVYIRTAKNANTWNTWRTIIHDLNYTSYTVKKDGTGASGTWGISITGNAKTATNIDWNGITNKPSSFEPSNHNHSFTLGATTITTGGTCTAITGPFAVRTDASADKAFSIRRSGAGEEVKHWVDDSTYHIDYTNDETYSIISLRIINTDSESPHNPPQTTDTTVYLDCYKQFYPNVNNTGSIGTTSYKWANMYATTFHGSLDGAATYASNVGTSGTAGTNYVTASKVISACNWYDTMIGSDSDTVINRWSEIVAFVAGFKETPDLATFLSNNYLAKAGGTMTGSLKWKDNNALPQQTSPQYFLCIDAFDDGGTTKWTSKADTLKALTGLTSTAIGDSDEPIYWNGTKFVKAGAYPTKSSWNYDDKYVKLDGTNVMSGDLTLLLADLDRFIVFSYPNAVNPTSNSWRTGVLGTGQGENNFFVVQYQKVNTNSSDWNTAFKIGQDTGTVTFTNDIKVGSNIVYHSGNLPTYPIVNNGALYLQANGTTKVTFTANQSSNSTLNIATGSSNGTISVGGTNVSVKGLGSNAYSSTAYLPLAGGTMDANAQIKRKGKSSAWIYGRDNALIRETSSSGYHPLFSLKTTDGSWELGEYNIPELHNIPIFAYITDTNYNSGNNAATYQIKFPLASGTIALTADLKWSNISSKPETATRWPSWSEVTNKPSTFPVSEHNHDGRYLRWNGSAADVSAMAWGTLTAANGYTILSHAVSSDGGDWGMVNKGGKIYMQLDGYYYQNEGQYRVTDVSETVTALGTNGNYLTWTKNGSTSNITVPYASNAESATNANYFLGCTNTITVAGDANTYYPVMVSTTANKKFSNIITVWKDLGSKTASYQGNHSNGSSSMLYRYDIRNCYWDGNGGYCTTLDARYMYARLVSEMRMLSNGVGNFCIWLRGGGTEYRISTSWNISSSDITVYYSSTNVGSSTYPVTIAPRTDIGNGGVYNTITIPCEVKYASYAGSVSWNNVTGKPATATRWPSWSEVTDKPTFTTWSEISSAASYSLSNAAWTNTITLPTTAGSYILNIVSGNSTLTGVFSIGASDNAKDEISLHLHGNGPRLYARTNGTTLQLSSNDASATSRSVTIKYRRMI